MFIGVCTMACDINVRNPFYKFKGLKNGSFFLKNRAVLTYCFNLNIANFKGENRKPDQKYIYNK